MNKLNQFEIAQSYIGKTVNIERLLTVSYQNGKSYPECYPRYISDCYNYDKKLLDLFNITPLLLENWGYYGIQFSIYLYVENENVYKCKIFKYKETYGGYHDRPQTHVLTPTQQELRIFRRIINYITT